MPVTALYAGVLAALFFVLSIRVIGARRAARIALGHGDDAALLRRMRVHANFAEYAPFALLLMALAESNGAPRLALHVIGAVLVFGRFMHAFGVSQANETIRLRVIGMASTFTAIAGGAVACLVYAAQRVFEG